MNNEVSDEKSKETWSSEANRRHRLEIFHSIREIKVSLTFIDFFTNIFVFFPRSCLTLLSFLEKMKFTRAPLQVNMRNEYTEDQLAEPELTRLRQGKGVKMSRVITGKYKHLPRWPEHSQVKDVKVRNKVTRDSSYSTRQLPRNLLPALVHWHLPSSPSIKKAEIICAATLHKKHGVVNTRNLINKFLCWTRVWCCCYYCYHACLLLSAQKTCPCFPPHTVKSK